MSKTSSRKRTSPQKQRTSPTAVVVASLINSSFNMESPPSPSLTEPSPNFSKRRSAGSISSSTSSSSTFQTSLSEKPSSCITPRFSPLATLRAFLPLTSSSAMPPTRPPLPSRSKKVLLEPSIHTTPPRFSSHIPTRLRSPPRKSPSFSSEPTLIPYDPDTAYTLDELEHLLPLKNLEELEYYNRQRIRRGGREKRWDIATILLGLVMVLAVLSLVLSMVGREGVGGLKGGVNMGMGGMKGVAGRKLWMKVTETTGETVGKEWGRVVRVVEWSGKKVCEVLEGVLEGLAGSMGGDW